VQTQIEKSNQQQLLDANSGHLKNAVRKARPAQKEQAITDEQISQLLPMVHNIVQKAVGYLKPPLSHEDLVSAGTIGLVKAAKDFNSSFQANFKTYAYIRIRGAVLDELRVWSFVPSNVEKQIKKAMQLTNEITDKTGIPPTDEELAQRLGIEMSALYKIFETARAKNFISMDNSKEDSPALGNLIPSKNTATPDEKFEKFELIELLTNAIQQLEERQKQIIVLYYQQELTMKQIANVFGVTEPRISQLHASALFSLSMKLRQWNDA